MREHELDRVKRLFLHHLVDVKHGRAARQAVLGDFVVRPAIECHRRCHGIVGHVHVAQLLDYRDFALVDHSGHPRTQPRKELDVHANRVLRAAHRQEWRPGRPALHEIVSAFIVS